MQIEKQNKTRMEKRIMKTNITFNVVGLVVAIVLASAASTRAATWTQKTDMLTPRHLVHTRVVDGKIYAIGALQPVSLMTKVEAYDPATDTWTTKAAMPTARTLMATSVVNGIIYAIGGSAYSGGPGLATVEAYDPVTDTWTRKANMPRPRFVLATSVVNGKIYAIGGAYIVGSGVSTVEEYDPATDAWTRKADMPTARAFLSTCVFNGQIFAIGGWGGPGSPSFTTVEVYDPETDTWTSRGDMPLPRAVSSCSVVNDMIYLFGGRAVYGGSAHSTVLQYDPATDIWTDKGDMPTPLAGMGTSTVGGRIYVMGGSPASSSQVNSAVWEYDTGLTVPSPDFNGDGIVDSVDMQILVDHWHTDNELYDIAPLPFGDSFVDVQDLILLSEYLLNEVDDPTLLAHWALDEAEGNIALDTVSKNGDSDGYLIGDPIWQPNGGLVDGAIQLDGVDDYIITFPVLNPSNGPFSVLAWIKGNMPGQVIIAQQFSANWLLADPIEGNLMTELKAPGRSGVPLLSQTIITDGEWHRIGLVWDGSNRTLYVDSIPVAQDMQNGLEGSDGGLHIGTGNALVPGTYFSGLIDDVRIYNRVVIP
jgi:N-acetylneuraminic acid mutarotase